MNNIMNWYKFAQSLGDLSYMDSIRNAIEDAKRRYGGNLYNLDDFVVNLNGREVRIHNQKIDRNNPWGSGTHLPEGYLRNMLSPEDAKKITTKDPFASNIVINRAVSSSASQYENVLFHELAHANQHSRAFSRAGYVAPPGDPGGVAYRELMKKYIDGNSELPQMKRNIRDGQGWRRFEHYAHLDTEMHGHMISRANLAINYRDKLIRRGMDPRAAAEKASELFSKNYADYMNRANMEDIKHTFGDSWKMNEKKWQRKLQNYQRRLRSIVMGYRLPKPSAIGAAARAIGSSAGRRRAIGKLLPTIAKSLTKR